MEKLPLGELSIDSKSFRSKGGAYSTIIELGLSPAQEVHRLQLVDSSALPHQSVPNKAALPGVGAGP
jgi:hypothetical protein